MGGLKDEFIVQYMGKRQFLKCVGTLDHIRQRSNESLVYFYTHFNKELAGIDQVITGDETIRSFVRALGPRGPSLYDIISVMPINTVEEMTARVKSYIDLVITKDGGRPKRNLRRRSMKGKIQSNAHKRMAIRMIRVALW